MAVSCKRPSEEPMPCQAPSHVIPTISRTRCRSSSYNHFTIRPGQFLPTAYFVSKYQWSISCNPYYPTDEMLELVVLPFHNTTGQFHWSSSYYHVAIRPCQFPPIAHSVNNYQLQFFFKVRQNPHLRTMGAQNR
jgi:hypothetical protein